MHITKTWSIVKQTIATTTQQQQLC